MAPKKGSKTGGTKAAPPILKEIRQHAGTAQYKAWLKEQASKSNAHYLVRLHHAKQLLEEGGQDRAKEALKVVKGHEKPGDQLSANMLLTIAEAMEKSGASGKEQAEFLMKYQEAEWNEEGWTNPLHELDVVSSSSHMPPHCHACSSVWRWAVASDSHAAKQLAYARILQGNRLSEDVYIAGSTIAAQLQD
jgi:hypothetical protein